MRAHGIGSEKLTHRGCNRVAAKQHVQERAGGCNSAADDGVGRPLQRQRGSALDA